MQRHYAVAMAKARARSPAHELVQEATLDVSPDGHGCGPEDRDATGSPRGVDRTGVFDLGTSGGSDIASNRAEMIGEAISVAKRHLPVTR